MNYETHMVRIIFDSPRAAARHGARHGGWIAYNLEDLSQVEWFSLKWTPTSIFAAKLGSFSLDPWAEFARKTGTTP